MAQKKEQSHFLGNISSKTLLKSDLPEPLKSSDLECWELEDLFCLRKEVFLKSIKNRN